MGERCGRCLTKLSDLSGRGIGLENFDILNFHRTNCHYIDKIPNLNEMVKDLTIEVGEDVQSLMSYMMAHNVPGESVQNLKIGRGTKTILVNASANQPNVAKESTFIRCDEYADQVFLDHQHLTAFAHGSNMSDRKLKTLVKLLKKFNIVRSEPNVFLRFAEERKKITELFTVENIYIEVSDLEEDLRPLLYCNDIESLLSFMLEDMTIKDLNFDLKLCMDRGCGTLKFGLQIMVKGETQKDPIIFAACDCGESTSNITRILDHTGLMTQLNNMAGLYRTKIVMAGDSKVRKYNLTPRIPKF